MNDSSSDALWSESFFKGGTFSRLHCVATYQALVQAEATSVCVPCSFVGVSLSEPHFNMKSSTMVHAQRTTVKNGIATHYCSLGTVVHVQANTINLCILIIQVLCNAKIISFIYWHSIFGWYSQPCHEEWTAKITDSVFILAHQCIRMKREERLRRRREQYLDLDFITV